MDSFPPLPIAVTTGCAVVAGLALLSRDTKSLRDQLSRENSFLSVNRGRRPYVSGVAVGAEEGERMTDKDAQAFAAFVSEQAVGREAVIQSVRFYLAERLGHPDIDDLEAELTRDVPDAARWLRQLADGGGLLA